MAEKKLWRLLAGLLGMMLLAGCAGLPDLDGSQPQSAADSVSVAPEEIPPMERRLSTWVVYWDQEGAANELAALGPALQSVSYFEAYFDYDGVLILPDNFSEIDRTVHSARLPEEVQRYVSVVNDVRQPEGGYSVKDPDMLREIFASEEKTDAHIEDILRIAKENGFDGVEVDYEGLNSDEELWAQYAVFLGKLKQRTDEEGLLLRAILEPTAPFETQVFPDGIEYVVMCYNYYGTHSGPGPKASASFLQGLARQAEVLPGDVTYAIATGGFDWNTAQEAEGLTEDAAATLAQETGAQPERDEESQALHFQYEGDGGTHEVWYADGETLTFWMDTLKQATGREPDIAIWRTGGNQSMDALLGYYEAAE